MPAKVSLPLSFAVDQDQHMSIAFISPSDSVLLTYTLGIQPIQLVLISSKEIDGSSCPYY